MGSGVIIVGLVFSAIFGVFYLFFSTRNKERLALIEKGVDASVFLKGKESTQPVWKVIILNISLLLMGVGVGVFIATFIHSLGVEDDVAYPGTIFLMAGISLFVGFRMTKGLD